MMKPSWWIWFIIPSIRLPGLAFYIIHDIFGKYEIIILDPDFTANVEALVTEYQDYLFRNNQNRAEITIITRKRAE
jgi:hypothetical protein